MNINLPHSGGASEAEREAPGATAAYESLKDAAPAEAVGSVIAGKYKLLQEIGEGGMGSVFMADQTHPVKRRVAVKVIKAGMDSARVLARFEAERQALALMDHPNIAKVLDAGTTETGRPFFVMELVKGIPLTQFCDVYKLPVLDRLNLFMQVCSAVQHAHQKGIIHRDLKPTNILVESHDGKPVPKAIDFGLAKATSGMQLTEHTLFTALGQVAGTPLYMAPEQAAFNAIDVDTRADIYSLGVILYELLTGTTPIERETFKKAAFDEMLKLIREQEPPTPSSRISSSESMASVAASRQMEPVKLGRFLRGELDWIVMKSLAKERDRRYETATAFAKDIERFLNHEPVQAGPPSAAYKLRKFVQRNRPQVIAVAVVLLALVAGMAGTTFGLIRAERARGEAVASAKSEAEQRTIAEQKQQEAEASAKSEAEQRAIAEQRERDATAAERLAVQREQEAKKARDETKQVLDYLVASFRKPDPSSDGEKLTVAELFDQAVNQLDTTFPNQPLIQAQLLSAIGETYHGLGLYQKAVAVHERDRDLLRNELGDDNDETLTSMNNLALAYQSAGRLAEALLLLERTLELRKAKFGAEHPSTLTSMNNLAIAYEDTGRLAEALPIFEQTLELRKAKLGPKHPSTLTSMNNLAMAYQSAGRPAEALPLLEQTLELRKAKFGAAHPSTLTSMNNLAGAYSSAGRLAEALPLLEQTLELRKATFGAEHPSTLTSMGSLAAAYWKMKRLDLSIPLFKETLELQKAKLPSDHPDTLQTMHNLAVNYAGAGRLDEAVPLYEETLRLRKGKLGPEHPDTLRSMGSVATAYWEMKRLDLSIPLFKETLELQKAKLPSDHPDTLQTMYNLAVNYAGAGRLDEAVPLYEETLRLRKGKLGPEHPDTLRSMANLAVAYRDACMFDLASAQFQSLWEARRTTLSRDDRMTIDAENHLGWTMALAGDYSGAEQHLLSSHRDIQQAKDVPADWLPIYCDRLADLYARWGKPEKVEPWLRQKLELVTSQSGADHLATAEVQVQLGHNLLQQHRPIDAEPLLRECLTIRENRLPDDWVLFNTKSMLGGALAGQKKFQEAEPLLVEGYSGMKEREAKIPPAAQTRLSEAIRRLVDLYTTWEKPEEAAKWQALLPETKSDEK